MLFSVIVGITATCLIWHGVRKLTMTKIEKKDETRPIPYDGKKTREELIEKTLKQLFRVRLAGLILCAAAAVGLYLHVPKTVVALVAACGCIMQYVAYRIRNMRDKSLRQLGDNAFYDRD